jgi:hypothetical protein
MNFIKIKKVHFSVLEGVIKKILEIKKFLKN